MEGWAPGLVERDSVLVQSRVFCLPLERIQRRDLRFARRRPRTRYYRYAKTKFNLKRRKADKKSYRRCKRVESWRKNVTRFAVLLRRMSCLCVVYRSIAHVGARGAPHGGVIAARGSRLF